MEVEQLEQLAAVIVTAGLVAGNFLLFTPWRNGKDPRQQNPESLMPKSESFHRSEQAGFSGCSALVFHIVQREHAKGAPFIRAFARADVPQINKGIALGDKPAHTHP